MEQNCRFRGAFLNPRTKKYHFFSEGKLVCDLYAILPVLPFIFDAEVVAVAVVEVGGLGVFGVR